MLLKRGADQDRGSATMWLVSATALIALFVGAVAVRALAVDIRHRAEAVADEVALAAAAQIGTGGAMCPVAMSTAIASGARLEQCAATVSADGRSGAVTVGIEVRARLPLAGFVSVRASARAGRDPPVPVAP